MFNAWKRVRVSLEKPIKSALLLGIFIACSMGMPLANAQNNNDSALAQTPMFVNQAVAPLNMLVMGRDHKLYYEAYNDASDLNGDGVIDVGYKPNEIDYYGYFNNNVCYEHTNNVFEPTKAASGDNKKECANAWSGDFLNYLATSRMDAIRKVLYGGYRTIDTTSKTVLRTAFIPQDAHSWGKEYDPARDTYDITKYAPLPRPVQQTRHIFAVTTLTDNGIPILRVLNDTSLRAWHWVSKDTPVAGSQCVDVTNRNINCTDRGPDRWELVPDHLFQNLTISTWSDNQPSPKDQAGMDNLFNNHSNPNAFCGSTAISKIYASGANNNPFANINGCKNDNYHTLIEGQIYIGEAGQYTFGVDGDDAVDFQINNKTVGWYNGHGSNTGALDSHSMTVTLSKGWHSIRFRHEDGSGDDNWGLHWKIPKGTGKGKGETKSAIQDYNLDVAVCPANNEALREETCKAYPNKGKTIYKPTGLLHDFGQSEKMYFGLLTGSYQKNIAGGVVRSNMGSFINELDLDTGVFRSGISGIVSNINRLRVIDFNYSSMQYAQCGWKVDGPITMSGFDAARCSMWGNPISEMMFEALRYFSGAKAPHTNYAYGNESKDATQLKLSAPNWIAPYESKKNGGAGHQYCARPVMTVISDINPSYDYKLPGSRFHTSFKADATQLAALNVSTETDAIGLAERINGQSYFIGQSNTNNADSAPTSKEINNLSWARGLSPEEPSKEGTYYSAGIARFGANNKIAGTSEGRNPVMTYAVAIASPLPQIKFPTSAGNSNHFITISPFAKTIGSTNNGGGKPNAEGAFQPTDQIVDYYVARIANTGAADADPSINSGRPFAQFRINYEDVEQGADHDMDAIALYTLWMDEQSKLNIKLDSELASGDYIQHMGYVISGTTKDGIYLEVRDMDTPADNTSSNFKAYKLNTPPGRDPGYCANNLSKTECRVLPLTTTRVFTPVRNNATANFLKDPLWYAAKYGIPGRNPASVTGDPDNYFLVTNATTLKDQLTKAFNDIVQRTTAITAVTVVTPNSVISDSNDVYRTDFKADGWTGDLIREKQLVTVVDNGQRSITKTRQWSAAEKIALMTPSKRNILFAGTDARGNATLKAFEWSVLQENNPVYATWRDALNKNIDGSIDNKGANRVAFIRGEEVAGMRTRRLLDNGRVNRLGDIVNASPVRAAGATYLTHAADTLEGTDQYAAYKAQQATVEEVIYVGANDGMLHAFRASDGAELFAFIPSALKNHLNVLTSTSYGEEAGVPHRFYVDGTATVNDVYFDNNWHKVLIGSLGAGGRQIFALDVTLPSKPTLLWEFDNSHDTDMGYSLAEPTIARMNNGKWAVLLPNGYQGSSSISGGAALFVLDVKTGAIMRKISVDGVTTTNLNLNAYAPIGNGLSRVRAVDVDRDARIDLVYAGDLLGNLWRFDVSAQDVSQWSHQAIYVAQDKNGKRQPITAAPNFVEHPSGKGSLIIFGTGRFITLTDKENTAPQSLYGIWDRYTDKRATQGVRMPVPAPTQTITRTRLKGQQFTKVALSDDTEGYTLTSQKIDWYKSGKDQKDDSSVQTWGWYVDLPRTGERQIYDMVEYGRSFIFTSLLPQENPCEAGLDGISYGIDPSTGGATNYPVFDVNGDGVIDTLDLLSGMVVSGIKTAAGKAPIADGKLWTSAGNSRAVASGIESGRQSWRILPEN